MQRGRWVPIDKRLVSSLPNGNREYTELEAAFCVTCDHNNGNVASVSGYAKQWMWSRKRVSNFAKKMGWSLTTSRSKKVSLIDIDRNIEDVSIRDSTWREGTSWVASQEQVRNKLGTSQEQVGDKLNNDITGGYVQSGTSWEQVRNKLGTSQEQVGDKLGSSTINPNPNPNPLSNTEDQPAGKAGGKDTGANGDGGKGKGRVNGYSEKFLAFWKEYPKKQGKAAAWKDWQKMNLDMIFDEIMKSLANYKHCEGWAKDGGRYIPMASSWVHQKRWEDEVEAVQPVVGVADKFERTNVDNKLAWEK